ncbi:MAG TPA: rhamnogalacturonan lyase B N-terminal domain-containing protein [Pirellulales bacterium]|nr:rhamnogalacturonan lyase B N-terminal domain-containing protein [Pirellulales bacterium]
MLRPRSLRNAGSARRNPLFSRRTAVECLERRDLLAFGLTTSTNLYTVDTGAGLVFSISRTTASNADVGDLTSMTLNGTQLEAPYSTSSRYSHYESGLDSSTMVTATVDPNGQWILITCNDSTFATAPVIQYYLGRKGYNNIYMATYSPGPNSPDPGEMRFIDYTSTTLLTNIPAPSNNAGSTGAIESSDVYGHADGTTTSKYYGEYRAIDAQTYGVSGISNGTLYGLWMNIGNRETSSGGPFYKDIDFQNNELYTYTFSGHSQTEAYRPGLKGFYALMATSTTDTTDPATPPAAPDYSFIDSLGVGSYITGYTGASGRGTLSGTASGVPSSLQATVALSNAADQYWATPDPVTGAYTISGVMPGTYTETLYQGELAVGTVSVTIAAGATTRQNIVNTNTYLELNPSGGTIATPVIASPIFRIGTWDGTPLGFLNADKITYMHPTDVRMTPWATSSSGLTTFTVGTDPDSAFPMAEWHTETSAAPYVDTDIRLTFSLNSTQASTLLTLRIGVTREDHGRPNITVNSSHTTPTQNIVGDLGSRGLTTGNWRGDNAVYIFNLSAGWLQAGTNTIDIYSTSGSTGTLYSGYQIFDAIDLVPTSSITGAPVLTSITVSPSNSTVTAGSQATFTATARDQSGNVMPANFVWTSSRGTVDGTGTYTAPLTSGSDTVTATSGGKNGSATINVNTSPTVSIAAGGNPNPVGGLTTALSVQGADDGGESNLKYTWVTTGTPPATVNYSGNTNGTNAAKAITANFTKAGTYGFQVTITDAGGLSTTSSTSVVVNQTLTSITVTPGLVDLTSGQTQAFVAVALDQFGNPLLVQPSIMWTLDPGSVGSINASGLYLAPLSPVGSATARATSGAVSGTAAVVVAYLKGDVDLDGYRDAADVISLMRALSDLTAYQTNNHLSDDDLLAIADVNGDGSVTNADLQALQTLLRSGSSGGSGNLTEAGVPASSTSAASSVASGNVGDTSSAGADNPSAATIVVVNPSTLPVVDSAVVDTSAVDLPAAALPAEGLPAAANESSAVTLLSSSVVINSDLNSSGNDLPAAPTASGLEGHRVPSEWLGQSSGVGAGVDFGFVAASTPHANGLVLSAAVKPEVVKSDSADQWYAVNLDWLTPTLENSHRTRQSQGQTELDWRHPWLDEAWFAGLSADEG